MTARIAVACAVEGCRQAHKAQGWCNSHYMKVRRYGVPYGPSDKSDEERFWGKVIPGPNGCLLWKQSAETGVYGRFMVEGRYVGAHVWAFVAAYGPVPEGKFVDHICVNPPCVNSDHLQALTPRENVLRSKIAPPALNARKTRCPAGHTYDAANTWVHPRTQARQCLTCKRERNREYMRGYAARKRVAI